MALGKATSIQGGLNKNKKKVGLQFSFKYNFYLSQEHQVRPYNAQVVNKPSYVHLVNCNNLLQEKNKISSGYSKLLYNDDSVLQGNFSREQHITELVKDDFIKVHVTNVYMPLGLNYQHNLKKDASNPANFYTVSF